MHQQPGRYGSTVKTSNHRSWALKPFRSGTPSQIATLFSEACGPPCSSQMWSSAAPPSAPMSSAASGSRRCPCWMPCRRSASPWTWAASMQPSWPWRMAGTAAWRPWSWWRAWPLRGCRHRYLGGGGFTYFFWGLAPWCVISSYFFTLHSSTMSPPTEQRWSNHQPGHQLWACDSKLQEREPVATGLVEFSGGSTEMGERSWACFWMLGVTWRKCGTAWGKWGLCASLVSHECTWVLSLQNNLRNNPFATGWPWACAKSCHLHSWRRIPRTF